MRPEPDAGTDLCLLHGRKLPVCLSCKCTDFTDYVLREFQLVDTHDSSPLNVKQFQYTDWPEESVPASGSGLIDLIGQVQKWQRNSGDKPIIVHCR